MISLTLTRTELALADLTIGSDPRTDSFHIPEDGLDWPRFPMRRTYAPPSEATEGQVLLSAQRDLGVMAATIYAHASTMALLRAAQVELEAAVGQFDYDVTATVNGEALGTWRADPETIDWGQVDTGMARAFMARGTIAFSLHPGVL